MPAVLKILNDFVIASSIKSNRARCVRIRKTFESLLDSRPRCLLEALDRYNPTVSIENNNNGPIFDTGKVDADCLLPGALSGAHGKAV